ncbi:MAG TPA: tRNA lysidine(34) synthetase TilS [Candidatus Saccharimonadia bacterium]|jgi:tRNA(Ile)-lysidine synthetase-like protein
MKLNVAWPPPGRYILAVSGGADSMVLLDLMTASAGERGYKLVVAHFDHGLRPDSAHAARLVAATVEHHRLPFVTMAAHLAHASEAQARAARHAWLEHVRAEHQAAAIITAHHQDDLLETSLLNLTRGTGRRGLAPMQDSGRIARPLLGLTRKQLRAYAGAHQLVWDEDPTNADLANPRNLLRHVILPNAATDWSSHYLELLAHLSILNKQIAQGLGSLLDDARSGPSGYSFPRSLIRDLSLNEVAELIHAAARRLHPEVEPGRRTLEELALFSKTSRPHHRRPLYRDIFVVVDRAHISVYYMGISDR